MKDKGCSWFQCGNEGNNQGDGFAWKERWDGSDREGMGYEEIKELT